MAAAEPIQDFSWCTDMDGTPMFSMRRFAEIVLGEKIVYECIESIGRARGGIPKTWMGHDVHASIAGWIRDHEKCIALKLKGPHKAAIRAWQVFAASERCEQLELFLQKKRLISLRAERNAAVKLVQEYEATFPAATEMLDVGVDPQSTLKRPRTDDERAYIEIGRIDTRTKEHEIDIIGPRGDRLKVTASHTLETLLGNGDYKMTVIRIGWSVAEFTGHEYSLYVGVGGGALSYRGAFRVDQWGASDHPIEARWGKDAINIRIYAGRTPCPEPPAGRAWIDW